MPAPPPPDQSLVDDSPLERFLERAAVPILAVERGINARSRVLLLSVARDVGLPDGEFEQAVRLLQRSPPQAESPADKATEPFRRYLHAKLEQSTIKLFTPALEGRVVAVAVDKFALSEDLARAAIVQVAAERRVKRFSQQDCQDYVENLVAERLQDAEWLDDESVNRLRAAGTQWGLSVADVDAIIVAKAAANREGRGNEEQRSKLVISVAIGAVVVVCLVLGGLVVWSNWPQGETQETAGPDSTEEEPEPERPKTKRPPKWWTVEHALAQNRARAAVADYRTVYDLQCSEEVGERAKGYEQLVALARPSHDSGATREMIKEIAAGSYALEPEEAAAEKLRTALVTLAVSDGKKLPTSADAFDREIWAVETAVAMLFYKPLSEQRADDLAAAVGKALGISLDRQKPRPSVEKRCLGALATVLYRQLTAGAAESPRRTRELHAKLAAWSQEYVSVEELDRLDVSLLAAVLPSAGESWRDFDQLIKNCIASMDPLVVLKVLELFERTKNRSLQDQLGGLLLLRVRVVLKSNSVADVAAAVRGALGATTPVAPTTGRDRWEKLRIQSEEAIARSPPPATDFDKLLDDTLALAHLATLACALAQQEPGFAVFDQLEKDGPPKFATKKEDKDGDRPSEASHADGVHAATPAQREALARYLDGLAKYKELSGPQRLTFARGLAGLTERFADLLPEQGVTIARYLLGDKPEEEQRKLNDSVETLCRWKSVRLALVDLLAEPASIKLTQPLAEQLFGKALRRELNLGALGATWPEGIREQLLRTVLADLSAGGASDDKAHGHDRAAEALLELYRTRARLVGIGVTQYRAAVAPSQVMELLVTHQASQLGGAGPHPTDMEFLARLPHELAVLEYLGTNDIRRTVLAQRIWLRLLSIGISKKRPDQASAARKLIDELTDHDLKSTHVLFQLRDGELMAARMVLLLTPKE